MPSGHSWAEVLHEFLEPYINLWPCGCRTRAASAHQQIVSFFWDTERTFYIVGYANGRNRTTRTLSAALDLLGEAWTSKMKRTHWEELPRKDCGRIDATQRDCMPWLADRRKGSVHQLALAICRLQLQKHPHVSTRSILHRNQTG